LIGLVKLLGLKRRCPMRFLAIIWKNLAGRPLRSALTVLGLAIAVAAIVALIGMSQGFERSFLKLYNTRGGDLVVQHKGGVMQLSSGVDERLGERIKNLPGTGRVIGSLMDVVALEQFDLFAVIVSGWPVDSPVLADVKMISGRRLREGDHKRVMLGRVLAGNIGRHVGDRIEIYAEPMEIVGIFESFSVYENGAIFTLLDELQALMDRPRQVTGFLVQAKPAGDPKAVDDLQRQIAGLDPNIAVDKVPEFIHNVSQIRVARAGAWIASAIAVAVGVIGMLNTMTMSVFERSSEIGTLRALGWPKRRVMVMVLCESALLSCAAAAAGIMVGIVALRALTFWPTVAGFVEGGVPPSVAIEGLFGALLIGALGAAYPAYWAARLWPVEAMRQR
jgi:putative ABC transport system permease protein